MKAMLLKEYKQLEVTEVPEPEIGEHDLLVQVKACGICGSDIHGYDGSTGRRIPPLVMGHEAAGIVMAIGAKVSAFQIGDRVTFDSTVSLRQVFLLSRAVRSICVKIGWSWASLVTNFAEMAHLLSTSLSRSRSLIASLRICLMNKRR